MQVRRARLSEFDKRWLIDEGWSQEEIDEINFGCDAAVEIVLASKIN